MFRKKKLIFLTLLITGVLFVFHSPTQDPIRAKINIISSELTFDSTLQPLELLAYGKRLSEFVDEMVLVEVEYQGETFKQAIDRKDLIGQIAGGRRELNQLAVKISDLNIKRQGKERAHAEMEIRAMGRADGNSDYFLEIFNVTLEMQKIYGDQWVISKIVAVDKRGTKDTH